MKVQAVVHLILSSERRSQIIFNAIKPETEIMLTSRSKVQINREGESLILIIEANDTSALRASMNSYLRFISLTKNVLDAIDKF